MHTTFSRVFKLITLTTPLLFIVALTGCNVSTASLSNIKVCDQLEGGQCTSDMGTFTPDTRVFYTTANLDSAPSGTKVDINWRYLSGELGNTAQDIDSVTFTSEENSNFVQSSLERSTPTWPKGNYEVVLKINTDNADPVHKSFSVK